MYPKHLLDNVTVFQGNINPFLLVMGLVACGRSLFTERTEIWNNYDYNYVFSSTTEPLVLNMPRL